MTRPARPRRRAARPIEPPMRPTPTMVRVPMRISGGAGVRAAGDAGIIGGAPSSFPPLPRGARGDICGPACYTRHAPRRIVMSAAVHVSRHPLILHNLAALRDVRTEPPEFRRVVRDLAQLLFYEATADLKLAA